MKYKPLYFPVVTYCYNVDEMNKLYNNIIKDNINIPFENMDDCYNHCENIVGKLTEKLEEELLGPGVINVESDKVNWINIYSGDMPIVEFLIVPTMFKVEE